MSGKPVIAFGQQPCGIFPRRFLAAKIRTARRLQAELGGEIVFFYHDSDHDPRETRTVLHHRASGRPLALNFEIVNRIQRRFSPLYCKQLAAGWHETVSRQLPAFVGPELVDAFRAITATTVADFCLELYRRLGWLEGIRVVRSSDPEFRRAACAIDDFFVDVAFENEIVRARHAAGELRLHEGGDRFIRLPPVPFQREQVSATRDTRLRWMQSVLRCTHYVAGAGEQAYLNTNDAPGVVFVPREVVENADEACTDLPS